MKVSAKYHIHRTIAIIVVPLLLVSVITGFFRANQKWYWEEGYKKKKQPSDFYIEKKLVSLNTIVQKIDSLSRKKNQFTEIDIKEEKGNVYYKIFTSSKEKYLVEAYTGRIISPLSNELASCFAAQYVKGNPPVKSCTLLKNYIPRRGKEIKPAYKIEFDNDIHSQVFLDYYAGEILEDIDDRRQFGIWMIRLHEYDFFDSKRSITSMVGISVVLLALSGLWIYRIRSNSHQ